MGSLRNLSKKPKCFGQARRYIVELRASCLKCYDTKACREKIFLTWDYHVAKSNEKSLLEFRRSFLTNITGAKDKIRISIELTTILIEGVGIFYRYHQESQSVHEVTLIRDTLSSKGTTYYGIDQEEWDRFLDYAREEKYGGEP